MTLFFGIMGVNNCENGCVLDDLLVLKSILTRTNNIEPFIVRSYHAKKGFIEI